MSWKNRLMKKEKNKRNKQFGIKCKETNHLIELLGMLCLFGGGGLYFFQKLILGSSKNE